MGLQRQVLLIWPRGTRVSFILRMIIHSFIHNLSEEKVIINEGQDSCPSWGYRLDGKENGTWDRQADMKGLRARWCQSGPTDLRKKGLISRLAVDGEGSKTRMGACWIKRGFKWASQAEGGKRLSRWSKQPNKFLWSQWRGMLLLGNKKPGNNNKALEMKSWVKYYCSQGWDGLISLMTHKSMTELRSMELTISQSHPLHFEHDWGRAHVASQHAMVYNGI